MFVGAFVGRELGRFLGQPVGEVRLEPVAPLRADPQIPTRLPVDPRRQINPLGDLIQPLAIPGNVLRQMPVALRIPKSEAIMNGVQGRLRRWLLVERNEIASITR